MDLDDSLQIHNPAQSRSDRGGYGMRMNPQETGILGSMEVKAVDIERGFRT